MIIGLEKLFVILLFVFVSALARFIKVERLEKNGPYRSPNCSVDVTCHVRTFSHSTEMRWILYRGSSVITDIATIPGVTVRPVEFTPTGIRQTISINKCYDRLEIKCKAGDSKKSIKLYSGTGLLVRVPLRVIIGIIFGVLSIAIAIGALIMMKRRRAAAKARTAEVVTLNPPPDSYPSQTTTVYPQKPGFSYPQQNISAYTPVPGAEYPPPSGAAYPAPPGAVYPAPPGAAYPAPPGAAYPAPPGAAYPAPPGTAYPAPPGAAYPPPASAGGGYPQYPTTMYPSQATPYPQYPAPAGLQQPPSQDPPPYSSEQQPPAPGFK